MTGEKRQEWDANTLCIPYISLHPSLHALCMTLGRIVESVIIGNTQSVSIPFLFLFFFHQPSLYPIKRFAKCFQYMLASDQGQGSAPPFHFLHASSATVMILVSVLVWRGIEWAGYSVVLTLVDVAPVCAMCLQEFIDSGCYKQLLLCETSHVIQYRVKSALLFSGVYSGTSLKGQGGTCLIQGCESGAMALKKVPHYFQERQRPASWHQENKHRAARPSFSLRARPITTLQALHLHAYQQY